MTLPLRAPRLLGLALLIALALQSGACYRYTESAPHEVRAGQEVRVRLSIEEAAKAEAILPVPDPRRLEGRVFRVDSDLIALDAVVSTSIRVHMEQFTQRVDLPIGSLVQLELRQFDGPRTYGLVGVGVAALGFIITRIVIDAWGAPPTPIPTGPLENRRESVR